MVVNVKCYVGRSIYKFVIVSVMLGVLGGSDFIVLI